MTRAFLQTRAPHAKEGKRAGPWALFIEGFIPGTMSHSRISRARGHIVRILYVFAQFPMIFRGGGQLFAWPGSGIREENEFGRLGCRFIGRKILDLLMSLARIAFTLLPIHTIACFLFDNLALTASDESFAKFQYSFRFLLYRVRSNLQFLNNVQPCEMIFRSRNIRVRPLYACQFLCTLPNCIPLEKVNSAPGVSALLRKIYDECNYIFRRKGGKKKKKKKK